ncbi:hypothetical protein ACE38W_09690 [Chitinophaga sp. Hz27]|uniref:hypothetical protein n=1 Tax=Chitinophaga sp. Hz27 TaxID=3347169 RepID=UPI0035DCCD75
MRTILVVSLFISMAYQGFAQNADSSALLAAKYFREADSASRKQTIWPQPLYGPMLLVDPQTNMAYSNVPDSGGIFTLQGGVYKGKLPKDLIIANTAIRWQNRLWTVVLWPLPADNDVRLNLMMHECFHRVQRQLGLPDRSPTVDHLATMDGRVLFLLELQALKKALGKSVDQRKADLANALLFRQKRKERFPQTFPNESVLEMNEGLAEFTGMVAGRPQGSIHQHLDTEIDSTASRQSLIRAMAYVTGPVYGYLLYEKFPGWTHTVDSSSSFSALVEKYYGVVLPKTPAKAAWDKLLKQYNGDAILLSERAKEDKRLLQTATYVRYFTQQPVLTIELMNMNIGFNPSNLFDLGSLGTVYPTAEINDVWGKLIVSSGGMLMKDWKIVTLSTNDLFSQEDNMVKGKGWQLQLNKNWRIERRDSVHAVLVKEEEK